MNGEALAPTATLVPGFRAQKTAQRTASPPARAVTSGVSHAKLGGASTSTASTAVCNQLSALVYVVLEGEVTIELAKGKHGITVNALAPTVFRSPLTAWMFEDDERARSGRAGFPACCLRSHFHLGQDLPPLGVSPEDVEKLCPDELGAALLQHCYNEMTFLSRFLPSLFVGENRDRIAVDLPW